MSKIFSEITRQIIHPSLTVPLDYSLMIVIQFNFPFPVDIQAEAAIGAFQ